MFPLAMNLHFYFYSTSEQLFAPVGSLRQRDIAITAASIDASSPCSMFQEQRHGQEKTT